MADKKWTGRELALDLADTLRAANKMAWVEMPLGSVMFSSPQRADVLCINKSYMHPNVMIYEVKVSVDDFRGDITRGKYKGYFASANQVLFAVPQGMVKAADLPQDGVGLIARNDNGWHVVKAGRRQEFNLDGNMLLALLMRGYECQVLEWRSAERRAEGARVYTDLHQAFSLYGVKLAKELAEARALVKGADELRGEINEALGEDYAHFGDAAASLKHEVHKLLKQ